MRKKSESDSQLQTHSKAYLSSQPRRLFNFKKDLKLSLLESNSRFNEILLSAIEFFKIPES